MALIYSSAVFSTPVEIFLHNLLKTSVEQEIKLLTIVLSVYEFAVGEFPGRDRSAYSCMFKCSATWKLIQMS